MIDTTIGAAAHELARDAAGCPRPRLANGVASVGTALRGDRRVFDSPMPIVADQPVVPLLRSQRSLT